MLTSVAWSAELAEIYEERVAQALAEFLSAETYTNIDDLTLLLDSHTASVAPEAKACERIVINAWTTVLRRYDRTLSTAPYTERHMLTALLREGRWRALFGCEADAHAFVVLLTHYLHMGDARKAPTLSTRDAYRDLRRSVRSGMADWLPQGRTSVTFTLGDLAGAFFGEAWTALIYDGRSERATLAHLVEATRPPFLPGRLTADVVQHAEHLPALE
jgi:hypothetical protein